MSPAAPGGPDHGSSAASLPHDNTGPNILVATWTTWTIASIFVMMRFWTRVKIVHKLGAADWCILLSLLAAAGMCGSYVQQVRYDLGRHTYDIDDIDFWAHWPHRMEGWWFSLLFYVLSMGLTKVSICLLYLNIFTLTWARRACYAVLIFVVITNLWAVSITLTFCIPLQATWDLSIVPTFCHNDKTWWVNTYIIIVTDVLIFLLPVPIVLPLKLPRRQKLIVMCIFAVGFFVCLVSLIRLVILIDAKSHVNPDFTHASSSLTYWTAIEVHTAIAVSCAMTLKPLAAKIFPNFFALRSLDASSGEGTSSGANNHHSPPTIGSRPTRPLYSGRQEAHLTTGTDAIIEMGPVAGDRDAPGRQTGSGVAYHGTGGVTSGGIHHRQRSIGEGVGKEVLPVGNKRGPDTNEDVGEGYNSGPYPWLRSDGASERTESLARQVTARSIS
ncbi:hypothetical protein B0J18DRAFT_30843 [Chaetomium sp. MPI-SDFR-AT-0129]|nr:hypothetical protein B0J18DRAFT_30843 [Chaetomium sp. MPI-SDFR-AT-0129]